MTEQEFAAGHVFFRPGDAGDHAFLLHTGQVEVLAGPAAAPTRIGLFGPGEVFGEMALIEERPRSLTARAVSAGRFTPMSREDFEHQLMNDPARTRQYLRSLFERLRSLTARLGAETPSIQASMQPAAAEPAVPEAVDFAPGAGKAAGWVAVLHPMTPKAKENLPDGGLRVTHFPLRIGRAASANEPDALDLNDLWLMDVKPHNISRNHCEITVDAEGLLVRDRGSNLGCHVNDECIGGRSPMGYARLKPGDNVFTLGSKQSPYQFRVTVSPA